MQQSRRAYLRGAGALALGVGVAGCSNNSEGNGGSSGSSGGGSGGGEASGSTESNAAAKSGAAETSGGSQQRTSGPETPGTDAAATGLTGTVGDKSAKGLSFVEHSHYSMNSVQGVTGRIKNTGSAPFSEVTLHVTAKPGNAGPYTETLEFDEPFKPGDTERFKFGFGDGAPDEVKGYTVWATGKKA